jgi:hypothetical protein
MYNHKTSLKAVDQSRLFVKVMALFHQEEEYKEKEEINLN